MGHIQHLRHLAQVRKAREEGDVPPGLGADHGADRVGDVLAGGVAVAVAGVHVALEEEQILLREGRGHGEAGVLLPAAQEQLHVLQGVHGRGEAHYAAQ